VVLLGDSLTQGTPEGGGTTASWIWKLSDMCGWHDVWNAGRGGTGPVVAGAFGNYVSRIPSEVASQSPNIVFVTSYFNDHGHPPSEIAAAVANTIDAIRAISTHPLVVLTGNYDAWGFSDPTYEQIDAALQPECTERRVPFIEPRTGNVYDQSGEMTKVGGPWITQANSQQFLLPRSAHQTVEGHAYFARRMFDAIQAIH
jgi:hypothetical protein